MESEGLHVNIDYVGSSGVVLSTEQKAALQSSLVILKNNYKFARVLFWGKILGVKNDYFIVQGIGKDDLKEKKSLYSQDCIHWGMLPVVTARMRNECSFVKGRFTGDPSYEYEHTEAVKMSNQDAEKAEGGEEENTILIKEEDRLATVIEAIDYDVRIVPRGAYIRTATGSVLQNRCFEGLSVADGGKLSSYFHFRDPVIFMKKSLLQKAELDKAIDFVDPIDTDVPKGGSWSIQFERGSGLVTLRSLHWLGFSFYHVPGTRKYGSVYVGTGNKNLDLPFML
ncbi:radial spoke head protein 9 homolog [Actinia tenebrosa]|uniref:Radial spoke head protein 9 homolog n=1 Tax=Actinia tenebrosa TaxID=6105 RepID=A0A6P8IGX5_ACTTE|nr:radial spoke head protein 9 homolog [Actinia tenebrosa]